MERHVKVDGKVRTDPTFPAGFMDVIELTKAGDVFRLVYDTKGRFVLHRIDEVEKTFKLCRVKATAATIKSVPTLTTHDGRTIRFPDPDIKVNDVVKVEIATGKILSFMKFESGNQVIITKGRNTGRVGVITHVEKHPGSFDIVVVRDTVGHSFSTRSDNVFIIGEGDKACISLPKGNGIKLSILEEREMIAKKLKTA